MVENVCAVLTTQAPAVHLEVNTNDVMYNIRKVEIINAFPHEAARPAARSRLQ